MKKILLLVTSAAIAFGIVGAAASSLGSFSAFNVPAAATQTINAACSSGATISYTAGTAAGSIDSIVLDLNDGGACTDKSILWKVGTLTVVDDTIDGSLAAVASAEIATDVDAYAARSLSGSDNVITITKTSSAGWTAAEFNLAGDVSITVY